jgi:hypothetical protein
LKFICSFTRVELFFNKHFIIFCFLQKVRFFSQCEWRNPSLSSQNPSAIRILSFVVIYFDSFNKISAQRIYPYFIPLKVPKREIFDRSDFPDFYTIKSSWVGDLVVKILTYYFNFWGSYAAFSFWHAGYASVPDAYAQHVLKGLCSVHVLVPDAYAQCMHQFLTRMLSARISSWRARSACA